MRIVVTGGLGFIGSAVVRLLIDRGDHEVLNIDCRTYAATDGAVAEAADSARYQHVDVDISDGPAVLQAILGFEAEAIVHLAAETHVDRSIDGPRAFVETNLVGTYELLQAAREAAAALARPERFRFVHVSTDEVFGSLGRHDPPFDRSTPYRPRSPYSASKAGADHLVRAWHATYGLPTIVTNCSNNYGPFQFPEKLIPLMILKAAAREPLPVYGSGDNVREWLHVDDHAAAIVSALERGEPGETYLVGGPEGSELTNLDIVERICRWVDDIVGPGPEPRASLIRFVDDRPGHDLRYAVDSSASERELSWRPTVGIDEGLAATVEWYLANEAWWGPLLADRYRGQRLGSGTP